MITSRVYDSFLFWLRVTLTPYLVTCMWNFPSILLALRLKRHVNHQNRPRGPEIGQTHPIDPRSGLFLLNLSKKVKFNLFCINLDTGYLYVIVWIPKAFSLLSYHSRVVFTISNVFYSIWIYFKIKNIYIDSDFSTSNSQVYHYFEKKDY